MTPLQAAFALGFMAGMAFLAVLGQINLWWTGRQR